MEPFADSPKGEVCVLDDAKAARFKARTMLMPSLAEVREAIFAIPSGATKSLLELRQDLAASAGADVTCPFLARKHWQSVAAYSERVRAEQGAPDAPWWRVVKDGRAYDKLPGGAERQRELLFADGVEL